MLCNTDRMAVLALRYKVELERIKTPDGKISPSPESLLREVIEEAGLSERNLVDPKDILKEFHRR